MRILTLTVICTVIITTACTKTRTDPHVINPPPDSSAFRVTAYLNKHLLRHNTTDTIIVDSAAGVTIEASWPRLNNEVQLWASLYSADSATYKWQEVHGYDYSHIFTWESSILPKKGLLNIIGIPEASSKKKPDTLNAYIIIK